MVAHPNSPRDVNWTCIAASKGCAAEVFGSCKVRSHGAVGSIVKISKNVCSNVCMYVVTNTAEGWSSFDVQGQAAFRLACRLRVYCMQVMYS